MQVYPVNFMARDASASLARSFREVGFALLTNHPINRNLIKESHEEWKGFFRSEEKYNFQYGKKDWMVIFHLVLKKHGVEKGEI